MTTQLLGGGPTNKHDRKLFAEFTPEVQERIAARVDALYDGTRTVARCWRTALAEIVGEN